MNTIRQLAVGLTAATVLLATATPALAKDGDVVRRGDCSGRTDWKVKAGPEDGRIEIEGEIDSNHAGQVWRWRLKHDGAVVASGRRTTGGESGSFEVRRVLANRSGTDTFVFRARRPATGEVCRGLVRF
jgi:hypothetical protein